MIYRITADMIFTDENPMWDILDKIQDHQEQAITINPGTPIAEHSFWRTQECNHDEHHDGPCTKTGSWTSN